MAIKINIAEPVLEPTEPANETVNIKIVDPNRQMLEFNVGSGIWSRESFV